MLEGWYAGNNLATKTATELINKHIRSRHERLFKEKEQKEFIQCCKCSQYHRKSVRHRDDMLIVVRKYRDKNGIMKEYEVGYCYEHGCAQGYKSHKERVGCQTY